MSVLCTTVIDGLDASGYDQMAGALGPALRSAPGFVTHVAYEGDAGWTVTEIWGSETEFHAFFDAHVGPNLPPGTAPRVVPLHGLISIVGMTISIVNPGQGELITAGPMTLRILEDGSGTEHRLGLVEISIPPGVDGPPQHIHRAHDETFYVISGTPTFTCGTDVNAAGVGTLVTAPPGTPHTFGNPSGTPAVILCTVTPDRYLDYFRELDQLPKTPGGLDHAAVAEIMRRYETETFRP